MDIALLQENVVKNNMGFYYVDNKKEAKDLVESLLLKDSNIVFGGSMTLKETGITDMVNQGPYKVVSRDDYEKMFTADYILTSTNAITQDGLLYNVDGLSNRVACISHGPKKVIVVTGKNKLCKDISEAILRVKHVAAPLNAKRLNKNTHCAKQGKCISDDINKGCSSPDRLCASFLISGMQRIKNRITVILVNEDLGY